MKKYIRDREFKFAKIPAIPAKEILDGLEAESGLDRLREYISVRSGRLWIPLDCDDAIEAELSSWEQLTEAEVVAYDYNFGFLKGWRPLLTPGGMAVTAYRVAESKNVDPSVAALVSNNLATYKELRDDYSLEEMFKLLDVLTVRKINEYRATEASQ